jgi:queuine tRNA-ribosyltransferase
MLTFRLTHHCGHTAARSGTIQTRRGGIDTPIFMPVGTRGTVKALTPGDLTECGAQIILGNTYHLYLRPGCEVIEQFGGLHDFMQWHGPILTDSGGFQVFSLAKLSRVTEEGYAFQSHIDGSAHLLTPESAVATQQCINADIMMCLDQCIAFPSERPQARAAMELTTRWAERCRQAWQAGDPDANALFGIVQGGMFADLRAESVQALAALALPGYAVGGLSVGEPRELMLEMAAATLPLLPDDKPRYVMGVGTPLDIVDLVALGADMFDCVMPTRNARNGQLFTPEGPVNIANARFRLDTRPVVDGCTCATCRSYSRAYLRHLYLNRELLAYRLNSIHNVHFYLDLMTRIRKAVAEDRFAAFASDFRDRYRRPPAPAAVAGGR